MTRSNLLNIFIVCLMSLGSINKVSAQGLDLNISVLDSFANESQIKDHINSDENYIILPVDRANPNQVNHLRDVEKSVDLWKNTYEATLIVIDISPKIDLALSYECLKENGWPYEWYVSTDSLTNSSLLTFSFFLLPKTATTSINIKGSIICSEIEALMLTYFPIAKPLLLSNTNWSQSIKTAHCQDWGVNTATSIEDTIINGVSFFANKGRFIKEDPVNGTLSSLKNGIIADYLNYNSHLCSTHKVVDFDGDSMNYTIIDIEVFEGRKYLTTDKKIVGPCGENTPWVLIQGMGSNGGLFFDIVDEAITTRLICHNIDGVLSYENEDYIHLCGSVSVEETESAKTVFFPNPASSKIIVAEGYDHYEIYSLTGQKIQSEYINHHEINISSLKDGLYLIRFYNMTSNRSSLKKLLKYSY